MWLYLLVGFALLYALKAVLRRQKIKNLSSRHVFITGCDHGFGRRLAEKLDSLGVTVYAGCLCEESAKSLELSCSSRLKAVQVDVTNTDDIKRAANFVKHHLGESALWGLVNNAGIAGLTCPFPWLNKRDYQQVLDVNLLGRIVNMSSYTGRFAPSALPYAISKFGVEGFSDGLSVEMSDYGITVHLIEPGAFRTEIMSNQIESCKGRWSKLDPQVKKDYGDAYIKEVTDMYAMVASKSCPQLDLVVDAMTDALLSKHPKERYAVGADSKFLFIPASFLSAWLQRFLLNTLGKLAGINVPVPACSVKKH